MAKTTIIRQILKSENPIFEFHKDTWEKNERRLRGGASVIESDLERFYYESKDGDQLMRRKRHAVYVNFGLRMATLLVGTLASKGPRPDEGLDFGSMGLINADTDTKAKMFYRSVDGQGRLSSQWYAFMNAMHVRAMATGHRWAMVDAPQDRSGTGIRTRREEKEGARPYVVEYSPLVVPNFYFSERGLEWMRIELDVFRPRIDRERYTQKAEKVHILHVRKGYSDLNHTEYDFSGGGWWIFDSKHELNANGNYDRTGGEIPAAPLFYERDTGTTTEPAMSRAGLTEILNISTSYMNLGSAGDFDALYQASRQLWLLGASVNQHETAVQQIQNGSQLIGVPTADMDGKVPSLQDSAGHSANEAIESRQRRKQEEARYIASDEITYVPSSSGESKEVGEKASKNPRFAMMAEERETFDETIIRFAEMRFGAGTPSGGSDWTRDFHLGTLIESIKEVAEVMTELGAKSGTVTADLVISAMRERSLLEGKTEAEISTITEELKQSVDVLSMGFSAFGTAIGGDGVPTQEPSISTPQE